jgi:tetratricopeptide (TPR) repeat protein
MLHIFLCHASGDKVRVRELYHRLQADGYTVWLDEENLLPGQNWRTEIELAIEKTDIVLVCLTKEAINKNGFVQREKNYALEVAEEKPEGSIFIIPLKFEECEVPQRLRKFQWLDYFVDGSYDRLKKSLEFRANQSAKNTPPPSDIAPPPTANSVLEKLYQAMVAAEKARKWESAVELGEQIIQQQFNYRDTRARYYKNRGNVYYGLKEYQKAMADYNRAIELDPNFAVAYSNRGLVYQNDLKEYQKAMADYNRAIELDPNFALAYNRRGLVYYDLKEYQKAMADYNRAIELDPNFAPAYNGRGGVYDELKEYQKALADYNRAIELDPNDAVAYIGRGLVYQNDLKEYQKAMADYNRAIELDPNYAPAYNNRGLVYHYGLKEYQKAMADYNRAIELDPNYASAYSNRGWLYRNRLNDKVSARRDFERAASLGNEEAKKQLETL